MKKVRLGVNIDHVATLRQLRRGMVQYPDIEGAAELVKKAGADQITIHLRGDRRHIQDADVALLTGKKPLPINLEIAATDEMLAIALKARPHIICLVPEKREEITTEGGLDVIKNKKMLSKVIKECAAEGIHSSLFIEAFEDQIRASHELGAHAIEIHTGTFANAKTLQAQKKELDKIAAAAKLARQLGLRVHAGHGLDYENTKLIVKIPEIEELNIGHSIVCQSVFVGLEKAVSDMIEVIESHHA